MFTNRFLPMQNCSRQFGHPICLLQSARAFPYSRFASRNIAAAFLDSPLVPRNFARAFSAARFTSCNFAGAFSATWLSQSGLLFVDR